MTDQPHTREELRLRVKSLIKILEDNLKLLKLELNLLEEKNKTVKKKKEEEKKVSLMDQQFDLLLVKWKELLPTNRQPTKWKVTAAYRAKFKTRWLDTEFRAKWLPTLERASKHIGIRKSKHMTIEYFLRNDHTWRKILHGELDFWDDKYQDEEIQPTVSAYDVWEAQQNG